MSDELIRVAILWHELWHEGLEEASRLYFGERNVKGMFDTLEPLHAMLERGPQTLKETSFNQVKECLCCSYDCQMILVLNKHMFNIMHNIIFLYFTEPHYTVMLTHLLY